ncbi:hypothetical protein [Lachnobacterium bovis]|uniref:Uncharacterized protein n=1 Tax=Lachnobacterium bovis DSM 14045 TaxID=1122142 RepID=A0A1H3JA40_9FIRM|nr:hypothetical protein [Lachnobacterium bovis]SDY36425.1 hypothetical protein SAMN02910414_01378 [Lachnobacterium bovis DSM 14045]
MQDFENKNDMMYDNNGSVDLAKENLNGFNTNNVEAQNNVASQFESGNQYNIGAQNQQYNNMSQPQGYGTAQYNNMSQPQGYGTAQYNNISQPQGYGTAQYNNMGQDQYEISKIMKERNAAQNMLILSWFSFLGILLAIIGWIIGIIVFVKLGNIYTTDEIALSKKRTATIVASIGFGLSVVNSIIGILRVFG